MKRDLDTHSLVLDADAKTVMEGKESKSPMFRLVKGFDVS